MKNNFPVKIIWFWQYWNKMKIITHEKKNLFLETVPIKYLIFIHPHIWKPLVITFPTACSEEYFITDGTHWQYLWYSLAKIPCGVLHGHCYCIICVLCQPYCEAAQSLRMGLETKPSKREMPTAVLQLSGAEGCL